MRPLYFAAALVLAVAPAPTVAFKPETHIWLADRLLSELKRNSDGRISIKVAGAPRRFLVSSRVRSAILRHPQAFRLGAVGPDALPGIVEGQNSIHPGGDLWGTGQWLDYVIAAAKTDQEIAFAYGMLAHAAGDVWAHSYVNHYAGNVFSLTDGELNVEARHILLEGYIANHTKWDLPPGKSAGEVARESLKRDGRYALPEDFLFRVFVDSNDASKAFETSGSPHITAIHGLYRELGRLASKGGPADQLHSLIQKAIIYWRTGHQARQSELDELNQVHQKLQDSTNQTIDKLQEANNELREVHRKWLATSFRGSEHASEKAFDDIAAEIDRARKLTNQKHQLENRIANLQADLPAVLKLPSIPFEWHCTKSKGSGIFKVHYPSICHRDDPNPAVAALKTQIAAQQALENQVLKQADQALERAQAALAKTYAKMLVLYDAETIWLNAAIDLGQRFETNENPIKGHLLAWQGDVRDAMIAYFEANTQAIGETMIGGSPMSPLTRWRDCNAPAILGVPSQIKDAECAANDSYAAIMETLNTIKRVDPVVNELEQLRQGMVDDLTEFAENEALRFASRLSSVELETFFDAATKPATEANLDAAFAAAPADTRLINVAEMSSVIDVDMALDSVGHLRPARFGAVANAETLMKLSLLSSTQIGALFGKPLPAGQVNILSRLARSIDGDYQWMTKSPPYARLAMPSEPPPIPYGYGNLFAYWQAPAQRRVFRSIFIGPLAPGYLEGPFAQAVPVEYRFRPTAKCSFPTKTTSVTCD